jgi:pimeloyl-ACP methyl ester carboxylesterase
MMAVGVGFLLVAWALAHRHPFLAAGLVVLGGVILLRWGGFWFWFLPLGILAALLLAVWELARRLVHPRAR